MRSSALCDKSARSYEEAQATVHMLLPVTLPRCYLPQVLPQMSGGILS